MLSNATVWALVVLLQSSIVPRGSRSEVFNQILQVFLWLGTAVGVVVIAYMCWKAYKYRASGGHVDESAVDRPDLGELPQGSGGGRKLFVSFSMSAIIVVSLIAWTYGTLLFVEESPSVEETGGDELVIEVVGSQFMWTFVYPNGHESRTLRAPVDREVKLRVTSADVFHNFGVPGLRVKTDAIPGQQTDTWFRAEETGTHTAHCYELCGSGHSYMDAEVRIMEQQAYEEWYSNTTPSNATATPSGDGASDHGRLRLPTGVNA
ncbi:cytochrome c oxidase subunit II [Haloplanus sp. GCM10025708]|uniref:cytochrome c oxidase subunit II n=1 Tax=Haloferacaceae TaxID=1644056 RepID=UPI00360D5FF3